MKNIYDKYIKISNNEKMSDSIFKARITLSVIAILSCVTIMISTAFALFSSNLTQEFTMQAATWDIYIEETSRGRASSFYTCPEIEGEMHEFTLSPCGTATEGYCIIRITDNNGDRREYCTPSFKNDKTIRIQAVAGCVIEFEPRWGNPKDYDITDTCRGTIIHSFTPLPEKTSAEDGQTDGSSTLIEINDSQTEGSTETSREISSSEAEASSDETEATEGETESSKSSETEISSDETEISSSETELSGSSETSEESTGNSSTESSASSTDESSLSSSQESSTSSDNSKNSESSSSSESASTPAQSSGDVGQPPSNADTPSSTGSASESSSSSGSGETSSAPASGDSGNGE